MLLAGALGYSAYAWWQNDSLSKTASEREDKNAALTQENATLKELVSKTENERDALAKEDQKPASTTPSDQEAITIAAKNYADAITGTDGVNNEISQVETDGSFASAVVSVKGSQGGGGFGVLLKKVNDAWLVIYDGQNVIDKETADRFNVPARFRG